MTKDDEDAEDEAAVVAELPASAEDEDFAVMAQLENVIAQVTIGRSVTRLFLKEEFKIG